MGKSISEVEKVFVSTDDNEISAVAKSLGAEVIKRPKCLAEDNSSEWMAWQHAVNYVQKNIMNLTDFLAFLLRHHYDLKKTLKIV